MQVRDNAVLIYDTPAYPSKRSYNQLKIQTMQEAKKTAYSGQLSHGAKKRLARATTLLAQSSKKVRIYNPVTKKYFYHQLSFITLTVSDPLQKLSGKEAYQKLLSHFLAWMRRTKKIKTYLWKAELQKNGQIHYHITTPAFIPWQEIRDKWNNLQRKAGLLDKYYHDQGHYNANSTDIHEVINVKDMAGYLLKYITKEEQNKEKLGGKIWDCSDNLKMHKYFTVECSNYHEEFLTLARDHNQVKVIEGERFTLYKFYEPPQEYILTPDQFKEYRIFLQCIRTGTKYIPPDSLTEERDIEIHTLESLF